MKNRPVHFSLSKILALLQEHQLLIQHTCPNSLTIDFISYSSLNIQLNTLFFCKGHFKIDYLKEAITKGTTCYMSEQEYAELPADFPKIIVKDIQKAMALTSALFYDFPQNQLTLIALTGTKGKTSTNYFIHTILKEAFPGKVGFLSTYESQISPLTQERFTSDLTTPESLDLFRYLRTACDNGLQYIVLEVSSQAYKLQRVYGLTFDIGAFLNISPDHIGPDEHSSFEDYLACKMQLLQHSNICLLNQDMDYFDTILADVKKTHLPEKIIVFSQQSTQKDQTDVVYSIVSKQDTNNPYGTNFQLSAHSNRSLQKLNGEYSIQLPGDFNVVNATTAVIVSCLLKVPKITIQKVISKITIPGRMMHYHQRNIHVYVDYAHNLLSLQNVTQFIQKKHKTGRLIVVLGAPGNKAQSRRQDFASVLSQYADKIILTSDDPNYENPADICEEIKNDITDTTIQVEIEIDRATAIVKALTSAQEHDSILIAGKGTDAYQKINGARIPYESDTTVVEHWFNKGEL